ncbi:hypothetical protein C8J56DRAFT_891787 [Mycena floridula]|nr:hypothetical protein C8J56DRAFT_891787 [Mycena floridula]
MVRPWAIQAAESGEIALKENDPTISKEPCACNGRVKNTEEEKSENQIGHLIREQDFTFSARFCCTRSIAGLIDDYGQRNRGNRGIIDRASSKMVKNHHQAVGQRKTRPFSGNLLTTFQGIWYSIVVLNWDNSALDPVSVKATIEFRGMQVFPGEFCKDLTFQVRFRQPYPMSGTITIGPNVHASSESFHCSTIREEQCHSPKLDTDVKAEIKE